jgi:p-hydroxybenzoate 3-monooxygenase
MTTMLHRRGDDFDAQLQLSQLRRVVTSRAAASELAENYAGIPTAGKSVLFNETPMAAPAATA